MAKSSGLGAWLAHGGYLISNDVRDVSIATPHGVFDVTGLDKSARETLLTLRDGTMSFNSFFNDATDQAFDALSSLPRADVLTTYGHRDAQGAAAVCLTGKLNNYDGTRPADGSLTFASNVQGNGYGIEWGEILSEGVTTSTGAEALASLDLGGSTSFGLQAYLHVFAFTGTSATIAIQESSDDGSGDAFANITGGGFTAVTTAPTTQRIATAGNQTIEQYLRLNITGTYSNLEFVVVVNVNQTATVF